MLAVRRQGADRLGALRVGRVLAAGLRGAGVDLVHYQEVEGPRIPRGVRYDIAEQPQRPVTLEPVDADDQPRVMRPRVRVQTAGPAQLLEQRGVDDAELQAELVPHLVVHCRVRPAGQTISMVLTRCLSVSSCITRPASMVLPRPTSSAISRFVRGMDSARTTGSSW